MEAYRFLGVFKSFENDGNLTLQLIAFHQMILQQEFEVFFETDKFWSSNIFQCFSLVCSTTTRTCTRKDQQSFNTS
jgi:hypothetical protein